MNNINFVKGMKETPLIFSANYFMKSAEGRFMTGKLAKKVWLHWAEGRIHGEYEAYDTPTGRIPRYSDIKRLFKELLNEDFSEADYKYLFTFRCGKWLEKLDRTAAFFRKMDPSTPAEIFAFWDAAKRNIADAAAKYGAEILPGSYIS